LVQLPLDQLTKQRLLTQVIALVFGWIWARDEPSPNRNVYIGIPHCDRHFGGSGLLSDVSVTAIDRYTGLMSGVSLKFIRAMEASSKPPSAADLAACDTGPLVAPEQFLGSIDDSSISTPQDFLADLEDDQQG